MASLAGIGLLLGVSLLGCSRPSSVRVEVKNASGVAIENVAIVDRAETGEVEQIFGETGELEVDGSTTVKIKDFVGEGSYQLEVVFEDGRQLQGGGSYIEPGYRMEETILADKIETESKY